MAVRTLGLLFCFVFVTGLFEHGIDYDQRAVDNGNVNQIGGTNDVLEEYQGLRPPVMKRGLQSKL